MIHGLFLNCRGYMQSTEKITVNEELESHKNPQSGKVSSGPRIKPGTS
jgi:hypothetical protein